MNKFISSLLVLSVCWCAPSLASIKKQIDIKHKELSTIRKELNLLRKDISHTQATHDQLQEQLKNNETHLGKLNFRIDKLSQGLTSTENQLKQLHNKQAALTAALQQQRIQLTTQLRAAYLTGEQPFIKLLLNQKELISANRLLEYYRYLNKPFQNMIVKSQHTLDDLVINETEIQEKSQTLNELNAQLTKEREALTRQTQQRKQLLVQLKNQIYNKQQKVNILQKNAGNLDAIVRRLTYVFHHPEKPQHGFDKSRGALYWPTQGNINLEFGAPYPPHSQLHSNGVVIKAPAGQNIVAINDGEIIFAGWLRGYGLLVIIDHDDGYMSLYGRNQSISKQTGDKIKRGEVIAKVGASGGYNDSALYFEIRDHGKPANPRLWCRS